MEFLILADNYYPIPHANSICLRSLVSVFESEGHNCKIINRLDEGIHENDTDKVYNFNCSKVPKYSSLLRFIYKLSQLFVYPHVYKRLVSAYYDKIMSLDLSQVDVIISVCNPIESVMAASAVKQTHPGIRHIIYNVDTLSDFRIRWMEAVCCPFWRAKALRTERAIFECADFVDILQSHREHFSSRQYMKYTSKFIFQEIPLLKINAVNKDNERCLYAGRFYKDFREPKVLLNLFNNTTIGLDVYTTKDFYDVINTKYNLTSNIRIKQYIPSEELVVKSSQSKILVSIGNKSSRMFPSKIVSYVSMCKPIIHVFYDDVDPVLEYLKQYPDVLFVDLRNPLEMNRTLVLEFCTREHMPISPFEIEKKYKTSTPEYCAKEILAKLIEM